MTVAVHIGGERYWVSRSDGGLRPDPDPAYRAFHEFGGQPAAGDVPVDVVVGAIPPAPARPPLFDSGESWVLYQDGEEYSLYLRRTTFDRSPIWMTRFGRGCPRITMHVDPSYGDSVPFRYPLDQLVSMYRLAGRGLIVHGVGFERGGQLYLCPGVSGAGKTTMATLLEGEDVRVLSDDRVIIRREGGRFVGHGSPWPGEGGHARRSSAPLAAMLYLTKSADGAVRIDAMAPAQAARRLFKVSSVPWFDPDVLPEVLGFLSAVVEAVPQHELVFTPDDAAVRTLLAFTGPDRETLHAAG